MSDTFNINGNKRRFPPEQTPSTVQQLLDILHINNATVVAEIDGQIIERNNFADTPVKPGQQIELVRFIGGG